MVHVRIDYRSILHAAHKINTHAHLLDGHEVTTPPYSGCGIKLRQNFNMARLPDMPELVLLHMADYLSPEDTVRLARTCRRFYSILPSFLVMKGEDFHAVGPSYQESVRNGAPPELYFDGPPLTSTVKKLNMSIVWKDQGWGNLKGEIFVRLMRPSKEAKSRLPWSKKRDPEVVAEKRRVFGIAKHREEDANTEITNDSILKLAEPGDFYRFMRNVGGGGGHTLTVKKFRAVATLTQTRQ